MDKQLTELLKSIPEDKLPELIKAASKAVDKEKLFALANEAGLSITEEQAEAVLKAFSEKVSLSSDDMDNISGGKGKLGCNGC